MNRYALLFSAIALVLLLVVPIYAQTRYVNLDEQGYYEDRFTIPCKGVAEISIWVTKYRTVRLTIAPSADAVRLEIFNPDNVRFKYIDSVPEEITLDIPIEKEGLWRIVISYVRCNLNAVDVHVKVRGLMPKAATPTAASPSPTPPPPAAPFPMSPLMLAAIGGGIVVVVVAVAAVMLLRKPKAPPQPPPPPPPSPAPQRPSPPPSPPPSTAEGATQVVSPAMAAPPSSETMVMFASLVLPDGRAIPITAPKQIFGRKDFEPYVPRELLNFISRRHFAIYFNPNEGFTIEDLGSTNGTYVNGEDIRGKGRVPIKNGDTISIAGVINLTFKAGA